MMNHPSRRTTKSIITFLLYTLHHVTIAEDAIPNDIIALKKFSSGYKTPLAILDTKDKKDKRLFVVQKDGIVKIANKQSGKVLPTSFLDVSGSLGPCTGYCTERGLLGMAFHPDFKTNGYFYINYTQEISGSKVLNTRVVRFQVSANDENVADASSETVILEFEQPYSNHNAGDLQFGPDNYLYITSGDGGSGGDPQNNGQRLDTLLGKILRIDVDSNEQRPYAIPPTNPFVSNPNARDEIWAYGLRNPWKISFDRVDGDLYVADVGQNSWEEINVQSASSGGGENYGWKIWEGNHCYSGAECERGDAGSMTFPILEYDHKEGACSVTGGYRYRGKEGGLDGTYFYGDFCNGYIWGATQNGDGGWETTVVLQSGMSISSFGEDANGNLYVVDYGDGVVYKIKGCGGVDDESFFFKRKNRTCEWMGKNQKRIDKFCKKRKVSKNCKATCSNC